MKLVYIIYEPIDICSTVALVLYILCILLWGYSCKSINAPIMNLLQIQGFNIYNI